MLFRSSTLAELATSASPSRPISPSSWPGGGASAPGAGSRNPAFTRTFPTYFGEFPRHGLLAGENGVSPELLRGAAHLVRTQNTNGTWDESLWTGTGFPRHFYLRCDGYWNYFPLMALGQLRDRLEHMRPAGSPLPRPQSVTSTTPYPDRTQEVRA